MSSAKKRPLATVESPSAKHVPILTPGKVTPEILVDWFAECENYFDEKTIADDEKVSKVLSGLKDPLIKAWINPNRTRIKGFSWKTFQAEIKKELLPRDWVDKFRFGLANRHQDENEEFWDFANHFESMNSVLLGTEHYLEGRPFIDKITANTCEDLRIAILTKKGLKEITEFVEWRETVATMDEKRLSERNKFLKLLAATRASTNTSTPSSHAATPSNSNTNTNNPRLPKLTEEERVLLVKHDGCYKCRRFYAGHCAPQCPNNFPDAKSYRQLSENDALAAARKGKQVAQRTVAAVADPLGSGSTAPLTTIAAVRASPSALTTGVLGYGTDSDDDLCVPLPPLFVSHLYWNAILHNSHGPTWPRAVKMLIDSGSPTVLIREDIASTFELRRRRLPENLPLGNAWGTENSVATEWVKLRVSTPCNTWTSITVMAIVAPRLCAPVLLGRSFLKPNKLSEDHENDRLIHNPTGMDFLHLPTPTPPPPKLTPQECRREKAHQLRETQHVINQKRKEIGSLLQQEINNYLRDKNIPRKIHIFNTAWTKGREKRLKLGKVMKADENEPQNRYCPIAATRTKIEHLAFLSTLQTEDENMKSRFSDRFPDDIPHLDELPSTIYH
ncbi:hypothetical protein NLI96_g8441 [Meripilus lineatus]|uniref:Retrotransposon gag domain-containing protein n=1 Tax=Meripilus lineatus TaxID=2056292 RepID=A0AAD5UX94_9APHY|nr:hypothetical protein NLI96_g8441 [Physisporinus lineatus]